MTISALCMISTVCEQMLGKSPYMKAIRLLIGLQVLDTILHAIENAVKMLI